MMRAIKHTALAKKYITTLMAGVAICGFSSLAYADDTTVEGYKIPRQVEGSQGGYLKESPYVQRQKRLENSSVQPDLRRRPMRFSTGGSLPNMPRFDSYGALDTGVEDSNVETLAPLTTPMMADQEPLAPMVDTQALPEIIKDVSLDEMPVEMPAEMVVEMPAEMPVALPVDLPVAPVLDLAMPKMPATPKIAVVEPMAIPVTKSVTTQAVQPRSILDGVFSLFGKNKSADVPAETSAIGDVPTIITPPVLRVKQPVNIAPRDIAIPPLGDPIKSIVIEKSPDGFSSLQRTRDIIVPPEIKELKAPSVIPIPPLALSQDRFVEDLIMPEPPVSAMVAINEPVVTPEIKAPIIEAAKFVAPVIEAPEVVEPLAQLTMEIETPVAVVATETSVENMLERAVQMIETPVGEAISPLAEVPSALAVIAEEAIEAPVVEFETAALPVEAPKLRHEVIMQPIGTQKLEAPVADLKKEMAPIMPATAAEVVVEEAVKISPDSKLLLKNFPTGLNNPLPESKKEKVSISRATVPNLQLNAPEIKKHEAMGISIQVKKPNIDVNDYLVMAYEAMEADQLDLAAEYYEEILAHRAQNEDAMLGLATVYHRSNQLDKARKLYRQLLATAPRDPSVLNNFLVLVSQESPQEALNELLQLEQKNPHYDVLPAQISALYASEGKMEHAIEKMARAISLNSDNLLYHYNLAVMLDHAGRSEQAIQVYTHVKAEAQKGNKIPTDISHIQERLTFLLSNRTS